MGTDPQRAARTRARFAGRVESLPEIAAQSLVTPIPAPPFDPLGLRRIWVTGLGSSEAHARLLVACLADELGMDARFVPTGALVDGPPADAERDGLVVFSQGLSPNARFALQRPESWGALCLATAVPDTHADATRRELLTAVDVGGGWCVRFPPADEQGTLVRVAGPLAGCIAAIRMAVALGVAAGRDTGALSVSHDRVVSAVRNAGAVVATLLDPLPVDCLHAQLGLLASGRHATLLHNLRLKWLETLLRPLPPAWELLDFSHGPFQEGFARDATWLALTRADAAGEAALLARLESMLDPRRHRLLRLHATLPGVWSLVEHEAQVDHLLLRALAATDLDLEQWPGRDADGALYDLTPDRASVRVASTQRVARLDAASSPEIAARLRQGASDIAIPLGATEQHGAHLPLATDTWIADALAARLCARHPGLARLPALALGCSREHASFPGTLSLRPATLAQILEDLLGSLAAQGFTRAFVFSAHGGNCAPLEAALPALRSAAKPLTVDAFTDLARLAALQHETARDHGIEPAAAGHHAGEFETSILLALAPGHVRREAIAPGLLYSGTDAQALFHPDLRPNAPDGVVGDPRPASPARANAYLEAWTDLLDETYRNPPGGSRLAAHHTKGVQKA